MRSDCLIYYDSLSTTNGQVVGGVYVRKVEYVEGVYSYTKNPGEATRWSSWDAASGELTQHSWRNAIPVFAHEAELLP